MVTQEELVRHILATLAAAGVVPDAATTPAAAAMPTAGDQTTGASLHLPTAGGVGTPRPAAGDVLAEAAAFVGASFTPGATAALSFTPSMPPSMPPPAPPPPGGGAMPPPGGGAMPPPVLGVPAGFGSLLPRQIPQASAPAAPLSWKVAAAPSAAGKRVRASHSQLEPTPLVLSWRAPCGSQPALTTCLLFVCWSVCKQARGGAYMKWIFWLVDYEVSPTARRKPERMPMRWSLDIQFRRTDTVPAATAAQALCETPWGVARALQAEWIVFLDKNGRNAIFDLELVK